MTSYIEPQSQETDSLEKPVEPAVLRTYVENEPSYTRTHSSLPDIKM